MPLLAILAAALPAGCGGSSTETGELQTSTSTKGASTPPPAKAPIGARPKSCDSLAADAGGLRATGVPCDRARQVMYGWRRERSCSTPPGASRSSCLTRSYRCQAVRADRGLAVSCARAGEAIAFVAKR